MTDRSLVPEVTDVHPTLYPFGTMRMDPETREMYRTHGILHTIEDGIVIESGGR